MADNTLTCWSCANFRPEGCRRAMPAFPSALLANCPRASYEPGSDEAERPINTTETR
jgi:hypothetical protein